MAPRCERRAVGAAGPRRQEPVAPADMTSDGRSEKQLEEADAAPLKQACTCGAQSRRPPPVARCVAHVSEYCRSTSIHGLRYVGDVRRPIAERLLWVFLFAISLALCSILIRDVWLKWERTPVIVTFAETTTPVWEVPFPAVTICSETKTDKSVFNYSNAYFNQADLSKEERKKFHDLSLVCDESEEGLLNMGENLTDQETVKFLREVAPDMEETIYFYGWRNQYEYKPSDGFRQKMTEDGVCFTFNMLDEEDIYTEEVVKVMKRNDGNDHLKRRPTMWSAEHGFDDGSGLETYPLRALGPGRINGLHVVMGVYGRNIDYICKGPIQGFKVVLHTPAEVPHTRLQYLRVPLGQDVTVAVHPHLLTTSEGLRGYPPHRRQCYFPSERRLRYFRNYTQNNCELECLSNITLHRCNCVSHHMPHHLKNDLKYETKDPKTTVKLPKAVILIKELKAILARVLNKLIEKIASKHDKLIGFKRNVCTNTADVFMMAMMVHKANIYCPGDLIDCSVSGYFVLCTDGTPICALGSSDCIMKSTVELIEKKVLKDLNSDDDDTDPGPDDCDCLPSCTDLSFDAEISQADLDVEAYFQAQKINYTQTVGYRMSSLSVYFKTSQFIPSRRSELYGVTDFIANCGGLLGLFMGFSLLSMVEIFYFFSIRLGFTEMLRRSTERRAARASRTPAS